MPAAVQLIDASLTRFDYPRKTDGLNLSSALSMASRIYLKDGRADQAEKFANEALRIAESIARDARQSADVGEALLVLSAARLAQGDQATARSLVARAVEALTNGLGEAHTLTASAKALQRTIA